MIYEVRHLTTMHYSGLVRLARFNVRLKPAPWHTQTLTDYALAIDPMPWTIQEESGPFVVNRSRLTIREPLSGLSIESRFRIEVRPPAIDLAVANGPTVADLREAALTRRDLSALSPASYLYASPIAELVPEIADWARGFFDPGESGLATGRALMKAIYDEFTYDGGATVADTPPSVAFRQRKGVCQDFAHIMIVAARAHGIPAAYVGGYLRTLPPPGQPRLVGADAMHAWVNLWCGEDLGWVGFDPTNNTLATTDHIFTAMGRDYADVAPLDGVFHGGSNQRMTVSVDVLPVDEQALADAGGTALGA